MDDSDHHELSGTTERRSPRPGKLGKRLFGWRARLGVVAGDGIEPFAYASGYIDGKAERDNNWDERALGTAAKPRR
jgi:hypothetical protein